LISIINYGLGNIFAFANILKDLNYDYKIVNSYKDLDNTDKIILPGVGSFDWAMKLLNQSGMRETLDELVLEKKKLVLGVCVGMQIMSENSEEGNMNGLGWIKGSVKKIIKNKNKLLIPHIGWNSVICDDSNLLCVGISNPQFYFLHSYYIKPSFTENIIGKTDYNGIFASIVQNENVFGTQFHPEKSHLWGINLIKNFVSL
jgi:imidazole glycerol-phosphate synthase subunit HisH